MPRRKNAKRAKKTQTARTNVISIQKLEKDFLRSPSKLAKHLNAEVTSLRQKDSRIKKAINKLELTAKSAQKRLKSAESKRTTPPGKKKYSKAKKVVSNTKKLLVALEKQLKKNTKLLTDSSARHEKFTALKKHLSQFEKDWTTRSKKKSKTKTRATSKPRKTRSAKQKETFTEAPKYDNFETVTNNDVGVGESTEVTS